MVSYLADELEYASPHGSTVDWLGSAEEAAGDEDYDTDEYVLMQTVDELKDLEAEVAYYKRLNAILLLEGEALSLEMEHDYAE